jgi:hypothetical protein
MRNIGAKLQFHDVTLPGSSKSPVLFCQGITLCGNMVAVGSGLSKSKAMQDACRSLLDRLEGGDGVASNLSALLS